MQMIRPSYLSHCKGFIADNIKVLVQTGSNKMLHSHIVKKKKNCLPPGTAIRQPPA